jgi:ribokinase
MTHDPVPTRMITVVGSINIDLVATVRRLPRPGETVPGGSFTTAAGGKGANQALAAARAGARVRMVGTVGGDSFAEIATSLLREADVDLSSVAVKGEATGTALILVGEDGENVIAVVPGANGLTAPEDLDRIEISPKDTVLLQLEVPIDTVAAALARVRAIGARAILNTAPFRQEAVSLLTQADIVISNEKEFDLCARAIGCGGATRVERMTAVAEETGATVVVTLGAEGAVAVDQGTVVRAQAIEVEPIDTVGAGDTFCGYLAASLNAGQPLGDALVHATTAGSLSCTKTGAQTSIPHADEVRAVLGTRLAIP